MYLPTDKASFCLDQYRCRQHLHWVNGSYATNGPALKKHGKWYYLSKINSSVCIVIHSYAHKFPCFFVERFLPLTLFLDMLKPLKSFQTFYSLRFLALPIYIEQIALTIMNICPNIIFANISFRRFMNYCL